MSTKAIINGHEFDAREYIPFYYDHGNMTATLYVYADSVDEIVEYAGEKADIEVPSEFMLKDVKLNRIQKYWEAGRSACEVVFIPYDLVQSVQNNADDIETVSQAITELAELVG